MKILLYYFSGTGNTKLCASFLKEHFRKLNNEVVAVEITSELNIIDPSLYDVVGFGYPIHAFNPPEIFVKYIKKLPKLKEKKKMFFFKVSGEPFSFNNSSSYKSYRILKKKGFELINEKHFLMPYNIMFKYPDGLQKQMYLYLSPLCKAYAMDIVEGKDRKVKYHLPSKIISFILRIEWLAPKINSLFFHSKKDLCTKCNKCINNCPMNALYINKKGVIKSTSQCALCMRCSLNCPVNAIHMGILNPWVVNGGFHYKELSENTSIKGDYVNYNTKGYFKNFRKYYLAQNKYLESHGIEIPVDYYKEDLLELLDRK